MIPDAAMTAQDGAEIAYTLLPEDVRTYWADYNTYYRGQARRPRSTLYEIPFYLALISVPVATFYLLGLFWPTQFQWLFLASGLVAVVWQRVLETLLNRRAVRRLQNYKGFLGEHRTTISPEGLMDRNANGVWLRYWAGVREIAHTRHHILFLIDQIDETIIPVPLRAFGSEQEAWAFFHRAESLRKAGIRAPDVADKAR